MKKLELMEDYAEFGSKDINLSFKDADVSDSDFSNIQSKSLCTEEESLVVFEEVLETDDANKELNEQLYDVKISSEEIVEKSVDFEVGRKGRLRNLVPLTANGKGRSRNLAPLTANGIRISGTGPLLVNQTRLFKLMVSNSLTTPQKNVPMVIYIDGRRVNTYTISSIPAKKTMAVSVSLSMKNSAVREIKYTVGSSTKDTFAANYHWAEAEGKHVLMHIEPKTFGKHVTGGKISYAITITNVGTEYIGTTPIRVFDNGKMFGTIAVLGVGRGRVLTLDTDVTCHSEGKHTIKFVFDPFNMSISSPAGGIVRTFSSYWVKKAPPKELNRSDLTTHQLNITSKETMLTKSFDVDCIVANKGIKPAAPVRGKILIKNITEDKIELEKKYTIANLEARKGRRVQLSVPVGLPLGKYKIEHQVDYQNIITEIDEFNNIKTIDNVISTVPVKDKSLYMQLLVLANCAYFNKYHNEVLNATGYGDWTFIKKEYDSSTGFEYIIAKRNDGVYAIAFAGTDDSMDIKVDAIEVFNSSVNIQRQLVDKAIVDFCKKYPNSKFYITGHSLGGYLTQWAAGNIELGTYSKVDSRVKSSNFIHAYTFQAPGLSITAPVPGHGGLEDIDPIVTKLKAAAQSKVTNFRTSTDPVSLINKQGRIGEVVTMPLSSVPLSHSIKYCYGFNYTHKPTQVFV